MKKLTFSIFLKSKELKIPAADTKLDFKEFEDLRMKIQGHAMMMMR